MQQSLQGTRGKSLLIALGVCSFDLVLTANAAWFSNSLAILADLLKESTDTLAVLAALLTLRAMAKPTDHRVSYGIGRLENLVSIFIGVLMLASAVLISGFAMNEFANPHPPEGTHFGIGALLFALMFDEQPWSWRIDPAASLVGVALMLHAAWGMASASVGDLLDASIEEATQLQIMRHLVAHIDDYERLHGVRSRRSGPNLFVEVALEFDPQLIMREVQRRIDAIRQDVEQSLPGARVSICPVAESAN